MTIAKKMAICRFYRNPLQKVDSKCSIRPKPVFPNFAQSAKSRYQVLKWSVQFKAVRYRVQTIQGYFFNIVETFL